MSGKTPDQIIANLRNRREMQDLGNGNVIDVPDADCEEAADVIESMLATLKPFADAADDLDESARDNDHLWESSAAMGLYARNLRAARTIVRGAK